MKTSFLLRDITPYLREAYGSVQGLAQLQEGDESQAFGATVNGRELVIRIASHRHDFDKDNLAASRWPEVLAPRSSRLRHSVAPGCAYRRGHLAPYFKASD